MILTLNKTHSARSTIPVGRAMLPRKNLVQNLVTPWDPRLITGLRKDKYLNFDAQLVEQPCGVIAPPSWIEQQPAGNFDKSWRSCGMNADGTKFIAAVQNGRIYTYNGTTWTEQQPAGDVNKFWTSCDISADGTKFIAGENGRLWTFNGSTWAEQRPAGDFDYLWWSCGISDDGTKFIASIYGGRIYTFNGSIWTEQQPAGNFDKDWNDCDINNDGTKFIAAIQNGRLYTYNGSIWTEQQPAGDFDKGWTSCSINEDGTKFIVGSNEMGGRLYTFNGSTWVEQQPLGDANKVWYSCDINNDGTKFIAAIGDNGYIYTFDGLTWSEQRPAGDIVKSWRECVINANGTKFMAGVHLGRLYTYIDQIGKLTFSDLTGVTIVSSDGTSTPTKNGNDIEFSAGTVWNLKLSDGTWIPNPYNGYDVSGNDNRGTPTDITAEEQDEFAYYQKYGFDRYIEKANPDNINDVPKTITGGTIDVSATYPSGTYDHISYPADGILPMGAIDYNPDNSADVLLDIYNRDNIIGQAKEFWRPEIKDLASYDVSETYQHDADELCPDYLMAYGVKALIDRLFLRQHKTESNLISIFDILNYKTGLSNYTIRRTLHAMGVLRDLEILKYYGVYSPNTFRLGLKSSHTIMGFDFNNRFAIWKDDTTLAKLDDTVKKVLDVSNGNPINTYHNAVQATPANQGVRIDGALKLDGVDNFYYLGSSFGGQTAFTYIVEMVTRGDGALIYKGDNTDPNNAFYLLFENTRKIKVRVYDSSSYIEAALDYSLTHGGEYTIVVTYDSGYLKIYVDGVEKASEPHSLGAVKSNALEMALGRAGEYNGLYIDCDIKRQLFINEALSPEEIAGDLGALYETFMVDDGLGGHEAFKTSDGKIFQVKT